MKFASSAHHSSTARRARSGAGGRPGRGFAALVLAVLVATSCTPSPAARDALAALPADWPAQMVARVNADRAARGIGPLVLCPTLSSAARTKADSLALTRRLSHTGLGGTLAQRVEAAGYRGWTALSENLAMGQPGVGVVGDAWMGSTQHRDNLLDPRMAHLGAGVAADANGSLYWVQEFGQQGSC